VPSKKDIDEDVCHFVHGHRDALLFKLHVQLLSKGCIASACALAIPGCTGKSSHEELMVLHTCFDSPSWPRRSRKDLPSRLTH